jgi:hypothetical protein
MLVGTALVICCATPASSACDGDPILKKKVPGGIINVWNDNGAIVFTTKKLEVDVDGAPNAYGPDDKGIEYICNGAVAYDDAQEKCIFSDDDEKWQQRCNAAFAEAKKQNWLGPTKMCTFGFKASGGVTDKRGRVIGGVPLLQGKSDPKPGYYVTLTSLKRPETPAIQGDVQARQIDAAAIPYFVLPPDVTEAGKIALGDIAAVWYPQSKTVVFAVYGDGGPGGKLGEGSAKLHEMLGHGVYVVKGGVKRAAVGIEEGVTFVIFPGSAGKAPVGYDDVKWLASIQAAGKTLFQGQANAPGWGTLAELKECAAKE